MNTKYTDLIIFQKKKTSQSTGNFYEDRYFKKIFKKLNKVKQKKIILN